MRLLLKFSLINNLSDIFISSRLNLKSYKLIFNLDEEINIIASIPFIWRGFYSNA